MAKWRVQVTLVWRSDASFNLLPVFLNLFFSLIKISTKIILESHFSRNSRRNLFLFLGTREWQDPEYFNPIPVIPRTSGNYKGLRGSRTLVDFFLFNNHQFLTIEFFFLFQRLWLQRSEHGLFSNGISNRISNQNQTSLGINPLLFNSGQKMTDEFFIYGIYFSFKPKPPWIYLINGETV